MEVLLLTVLLSTLLAAFYLVLNLATRRRGERRGWEQDALLPLADDAPAAVRRPPSA